MIGGLIASLGLELFAGRVRKVVSAVPRQVWIAIAVTGTVLLAVWSHQHHANKQLEKAFSAGRAKADADHKKALAAANKRAQDWKVSYQTAAGELAIARGKTYEAELRVIAVNADDLRLFGPGKAKACPGRGGSAGLPASPGKPGPSDGTPDASLDEVLTGGDLAFVPWGDLVDYAEQYDSNLAEVNTWRAWYVEQRALYENERAKLIATSEQ